MEEQTSSSKRLRLCDTEEIDNTPDAIAALRAIAQALADDDVKSFQLLLKKKGIIHFGPETLEKLLFFRLMYCEKRYKCASFLQRQLARQHHLPSLSIWQESDWEDLSSCVTYLTIDGDYSLIDSKCDALLDCRYLSTIDLNFGYEPEEGVYPSVSRFMKILALLPSLKSIFLTSFELRAVFRALVSSASSSSSSSSSLSASASLFSSFASSHLPSLPAYQHLETLNVCHTYQVEGFASVLRLCCPRLTELDISTLDDANLPSFTKADIDAIASLPLRALSLDAIDVCAEHCAVLADSLAHLQRLSLSSISVSSASFALLAQNFPSLTDLQVSDSRFGIEVAQSIADHLSHLTRLSMHGSLFTDDCSVKTFVPLIRHFRSLMILDLPCDCLSSAVCQSLASMPSLTSLTLSFFKHRECSGLGDLAKSTSLRCLHIDSRHIEDDGLTQLAKFNHSITDLGLWSRRITDAGLFALIDPHSSHLLLSRLHVSSKLLTDASCRYLGQNENITDVNLEFSDSKHVTMESILALSHMPQLMNLNVTAYPSFGPMVSSDSIILPFLRHPHLQQLRLPFRLAVNKRHEVEEVALAVFLQRKKYRRQLWQRICCLIAFERANSGSPLRNSFVPFVESQYWHHPNNTFSIFLC